MQVMVANIRCAEIARDQLASFTSDQAWQSLRVGAHHGVYELHSFPLCLCLSLRNKTDLPTSILFCLLRAM